jgi:hypothetical protein
MSAKDIVVKPITSAVAREVVKRWHYSGKVTNNSQLHLGVFLNGLCEGAMQFGPPLDRRKLLPLVRDTKWNDMMELNRMAFGPALPRNSESRALAIAFRIMRKAYPNLEWVVSFADGAQCGDGTIYRAAGFVLTGIKRNTQIWEMPGTSEQFTRMVATDTRRIGRSRLLSRTTMTKANNIRHGDGAASMRPFVEAGARPLPGFQLRYRMLDVSSYKIIMQNKYGVEFKKSETHRALDDIKESIAELNYYLQFINK